MPPTPTLVMDKSSHQSPGGNMLDLPEEIVEYILSFVPPYQDLKNCMLVCKNWHRLVKDVVRRREINFSRCIKRMDIVWKRYNHPPGPSIAARYTHCTCRHGNSMYVFGGCTAANTTFNDLWRFDLNSKRWIRPLAIGTYPPPKACATLVPYKDVLILFGGWTHPSPYPIYQSCRLFNHVHIYELLHNNWLEIPTPGTSPPRMAGHSASVHRDCMVIFGGGQLSNGRFKNSSNDIWVLDLITNSWWKPETTEPKPDPRFGQSQIRIDDDHILIVGGCGGPNKVISDMWLLKLSIKDEPWIWMKVSATNSEEAATHIWCHPACKVGDKVVFLDKCPQTKALAYYTMTCMMGIRIPQRVWMPPRAGVLQTSNLERQAVNRTEPVSLALNGNAGTCGSRSQPSSSGPRCCSTASLSSASASKVARMSKPNENQHADAAACTSSCEKRTTKCPSLTRGIGFLSTGDNVSQICSASTGNFHESRGKTPLSCPVNSTDGGLAGASTVRPSLVTRNTALPSIRPNSMKNRQRQLEGFQRMEERIRNLLRPSEAACNSNPSHGVANASQLKPMIPLVRRPMYLYVLDISRVVTELQAQWLPVQAQHVSNGPEETTFYSLICGRGELIMFGGIQKDTETNCEVITGSRDVVTNSVHILTGSVVL